MNSIMVVEDEQLVARDIADTLGRLGYAVPATVGSARQCIEEASRCRPDLVLMDICLGGELDGIEAAGVLRERLDIPVVYLSAYADADTVERAKRTRPLGYLVKPFRQSELRSAVEVGLSRHRAERQLRQRERWLSAAVDALPEAVIGVDARGQVALANRAAQSLLGLEWSELEARELSRVARFVDAHTREPAPNACAQALERRRSVRSTAFLAREHDLLVEQSAAPVRGQQAECLGAVMLLRDVAQDRSVHEQLAAADRLHSLGAVAAGIAHEINNPLTIVLGNAGFLEQELGRLRALLDPALLDDASIRESLTEMADLIAELGDGAKRITRTVADLGFFGRGVATHRRGNALVPLEWALRVARATISERAQLELHLERVPEVQGDEGRLGQVFLSLLLNAVDALRDAGSGEHVISVSTHCEPAVSGSSEVVVTIRDTGSGLPPPALPRAFEPFFSTKPFGGWRGLGLSACHAIVTEMGGSIGVSSARGQGTTFVVRLPCADPERASQRPCSPALGSSRGRVLVVDDDPGVLSVLGRTLEAAHDVVTMDDARAALRELRLRAFDVIVCDFWMPEMDGMEFHRELVAQSPHLARRVIFLSGGVNTPKASKFLAGVPNLALEKPVPPAELLAAVQRELARLRS